MAYTYRFLDVNNNVIYVGYTWNIDKRISDHFTRGHLPKECYKKIARIECIKWKTKCDAQVMEVYYINKYKPKYNKLNKKNDTLTIKVDEKEWKTYRVYKNINAPVKLKWGWVQIAFLLYLIYIIINFVANRLQ